MRKLSPLALAVAGSFFATPLVFAAEEVAKEEQKIEKIEITGSRIRGVDLEGTQPLTIISADDIKNSGANSVYDLLKNLGQVRGGSGTFSTSESGATSTSTPAGQAAASLRGLGPSSTLTLINGRRVAASSFAAGTQNFVDINSIPLAAIERVEILATGASAIYGADAVAGVINYILKKDYEGAEVTLSYANSTASSNDAKVNANLLFGTNIAGGNLTLFADLFDRKGYMASDRDFTKQPALQSNYSYLPKLRDGANINYYSVVSGNEIGNPDCTSPLVTTELGEDICAYYANQDDQLESPFESQSAGFIFTKDVNGLVWNTDFFYSTTKSTAISSPAPIEQVEQVNPNHGAWIPETALDIYSSDYVDFLYDELYIDPFNTIAGQRLWGFQYSARFNDPRSIENKTDSFRVTSSVAGELADWQWETAILLSQSQSKQKAIAGIYSRYKYSALVHGELCSNGTIADFDAENGLNCASGNLLAAFNPLLQNDLANDTLLLNAQEVPTRDGKSTVYGWDLRFSGDLMEFNDDVIRAAFGVEARKEKITDTPSLNARARPENRYLVDVFGFGSSLSEADRTQAAAYAEIYAPLSSNVELQLAGRYDYYDDFGSTFNPKVGLTWRPLDSLAVRGSWATSFRAPSLTQAGVKLRTTTATYDCSTNQTVADLYCEGFGDVRRPNVLELGNPDLQAETSESVSIGFAWSPTQDTTLTVDYWQFSHEKLVDTDLTAMLARTATDASVRHCGLVPEGATGIAFNPDLCLVTDQAGLTVEDDGANMAQILDAWVDFDAPRFNELPLLRDHVIQLENVGQQDVKGVDVRFSHTLDFMGGRLGLDADWTHYVSFERNKAGSDEIESLIGTFRYPENIASARISWSAEALYLGLTALYTSSYQDDIGRLSRRNIAELNDLGLLDDNGSRDVASWTTLRANIGYDFENASINLSVENLLDRDPPAVYGSARGFDSINHNAFGRNYKLSLSYFF